MDDTTTLSHYLTSWDLSHPELLTRTRTSRIYTVMHGGWDGRIPWHPWEQSVAA